MPNDSASAFQFRNHLLRRIAAATGLSVAMLAATVLTGCDDVECFDAPAQQCPDRKGALQYFDLPCGERIESVDSDAVKEDGECCYDVTIGETDACCGDGCLIEGRPLRIGGEAITAQSVRRSGWADALDVEVASLDHEQRRALAESWMQAALHEHASIASFSRFALELMALGAPSALVAAAHEAALDEVVHAQMSFSLASALAGEQVGPSALALPQNLAIEHDLRAFATATALDACINETLCVLVASEARAQATDPAVCAVLQRIVEDEARHAELAWASLRWAVDRGGDAVRHAVAEAIRGYDPRGTASAREVVAPSHGLLSSKERQASRIRGYHEVVAPAMNALLAPQFGESERSRSRSRSQSAEMAYVSIANV